VMWPAAERARRRGAIIDPFPPDPEASSSHP
jgi:hypothetical protein